MGVVVLGIVKVEAGETLTGIEMLLVIIGETIDEVADTSVEDWGKVVELLTGAAGLQVVGIVLDN